MKVEIESGETPTLKTLIFGPLRFPICMKCGYMLEELPSGEFIVIVSGDQGFVSLPHDEVCIAAEA